MLKVKDVARILNVSMVRAYALISGGEIPGVVRLGPRGIRVSAAALQRFIEKGGVAA